MRRQIVAGWGVFAALAGAVQPVFAGDREGDREAGAPEVVGHVLFHQKISQTEGGFTGSLGADGRLGSAITSLGDFDGDGIVDIAVGAPRDDDGVPDAGAVWIFFLHANATVKSHVKISDAQGGFNGGLFSGDFFGSSVVSPGDLDGDGRPELIVGAPGDDDGGDRRGALWVLFLDADGTVASHQKISASEGGFVGPLENFDSFGTALAVLDDLDGNGLAEIVVGAPGDLDGRGAVWILSLGPDGTVSAQQKISATQGGFTGTLDFNDLLGSAVTSLGDLDRDGLPDLAVGASGDDDGGFGGSDRGAVWILFLGADGTVRTHQKISDTEGDFTGALGENDFFGSAVAPVRDLDCDGNADLVVGARQGGTPSPPFGSGELWVLFLTREGTVRYHTKIAAGTGGFHGVLDEMDAFGIGLGLLGDLDGDGNADIAVGAGGDDDGGPSLGALWHLLLDGYGCFATTIFSDGFEEGDTTRWDLTLD